MIESILTKAFSFTSMRIGSSTVFKQIEIIEEEGNDQVIENPRVNYTFNSLPNFIKTVFET